MISELSSRRTAGRWGIQLNPDSPRGLDPVVDGRGDILRPPDLGGPGDNAPGGVPGSSSPSPYLWRDFRAPSRLVPLQALALCSSTEP